MKAPYSPTTNKYTGYVDLQATYEQTEADIAAWANIVYISR